MLVATAAAIGNMLQGWDNATIAGTIDMLSKCLWNIWSISNLFNL